MASTQRYLRAPRQNRPCCRRSDRKGIAGTFCRSLSDIERVGGKVRQISVPVLRDLQPRRYPDLFMGHDVVEKPHQRRSTARPADDAAMQAHRHHLWRGFALRIQHVKTVLEIGEKLVAAAKTLRVDKTH